MPLLSRSSHHQSWLWYINDIFSGWAMSVGALMIPKHYTRQSRSHTGSGKLLQSLLTALQEPQVNDRDESKGPGLYFLMNVTKNNWCIWEASKKTKKIFKSMQKASATGFTYDSYHLWLHKNLTVLNFTTSQDHLSHPLRFMPHHFGEQLAADNKNTEAWRESIKREARLRGGFVKRRCTWHNQKVFRAPAKVQFEVFMAIAAIWLLVWWRFIEIMMWTPGFQCSPTRGMLPKKLSALCKMPHHCMFAFWGMVRRFPAWSWIWWWHWWRKRLGSLRCINFTFEFGSTFWLFLMYCALRLFSMGRGGVCVQVVNLSSGRGAKGLRASGMGDC